MSLEAVISKMKQRNDLTPVTPPGQSRVNDKPLSDQPIDPVDPVDPGQSLTRGSEPIEREGQASNEAAPEVRTCWGVAVGGQDAMNDPSEKRSRVWRVKARGCTFDMIAPEPCTRAHAEARVRMTWPGAEVYAGHA